MLACQPFLDACKVRAEEYFYKCTPLGCLHRLVVLTHSALYGSDIFFSSRRRHTRCYRDWSSDVCSSDLTVRRPPDGNQAKTKSRHASDSASRVGALPHSRGSFTPRAESATSKASTARPSATIRQGCARPRSDSDRKSVV